MAAVKSRQEKPVNIKEVLTNDEYGQDAKLQAIQALKDIFKPPDKIFSKVRLESLLPSARIALEKKVSEKDFLLNYATGLTGLVGRDVALDSELLYQMEYILAELKKLDESCADTVGAMLWTRVEEKSVVHAGGALNVCKQTIERMVLKCVDATARPRVQFLARMAAASPQLFQSLMAVFYEVLIRCRGHGRVFEVTGLFISTVMDICGKEGKDFLGLYPKDCRRLVSLLMVGPELLCGDWTADANLVISLLSEMFLREKHKALILLSHYSAWVPPFRKYLYETDVMQ